MAFSTTTAFGLVTALILVATGTSAAALDTPGTGGVKLHSVSIDLPASDREFPPGPGADLIATNCQSCHSPGMILTQPTLTRAEWTGEVNKMVRVYKAPISDADAAGIVTYLASLKVAP